MNHPTDRQRWATARTLDDLGQLTAQWLEGAITYLPGYLDIAPGPETRDLIPALARANRAGYVTTNSQPATPLTNGFGQRAAVVGFSTEALTQRIAAAILGTDLIALITPPGWDNPTMIPVTIDGGAAFTWARGGLPPEVIEQHYADDCPRAIDTLRDAWQVEVIDPVWGRNDVLWDRLAGVWA